MRGERSNMMPGQAMREALARKHDWESHGPGHWGYGVAIDLLALERRVAALERLSGAGKSAGEDNDSPGEGWRWVNAGVRVQEGDEFLSADGKMWHPSTWRGEAPPRTYRRRRIKSHANHDAAPAARVQLPTGGHASGGSDSVGNDKAEPLTRLGTGDTQDEPVAFAVMSGGRSYDIYETRGEAEAICRWLCEEESGDIWRVVPLVPADATPESHATPGECSVHPCDTEPVAWVVCTPENWGRETPCFFCEHQARDHASKIAGTKNIVKLYRSPTLATTQPSHATHGECSVPPEGTQQPALSEAESAALYHGTAVLLWEGHTREAGSEGSRNLLQIAATLKGLRERLEGRRE